MTEPVIALEAINKVYGGAVPYHALRDVSLVVAPGEMVAIVGASGTGKSTLMNVIGCLDRPTSGAYFLSGERVSTLGDDELARARNRQIGFVFQSFQLLARYSALKNVALPLIYAGVGAKEGEARARAALERVGLGDRLHNRPNELSGGQKQRVAIARAVVNRPSLILADEPTGALDTRTGEEIMALFQDLNRQGVTMVIVTHEPDVAACCGRQIRMQDGRVIEDVRLVPRQAGL